jgi:hypothetical protein
MAGGVPRPRWLLQVRLGHVAKQLSGFGFELAYEGKVAFSVPVCHDFLLGSPKTGYRLPASGKARARGERGM